MISIEEIKGKIMVITRDGERTDLMNLKLTLVIFLINSVLAGINNDLVSF